MVTKKTKNVKTQNFHYIKKCNLFGFGWVFFWYTKSSSILDVFSIFLMWTSFRWGIWLWALKKATINIAKIMP